MQCSYSSRLGEFRRRAGVSSQPACRWMKCSVLTKDAVTAERQMGSPALISFTAVSLGVLPNGQKTVPKCVTFIAFLKINNAKVKGMV